jgi:hypothetical protein
MSVKQAVFSTEQRSELERLGKLVPTPPMKQAQAEIIAQGVISTQKLNSKMLDYLDALAIALTDGRSDSIFDFINMGTRGFLRQHGAAAFDSDARNCGDLFKLLSSSIDEAEKKGKFDLNVTSFSSELSPPDCRSQDPLDRKLLDALTKLGVVRAEVYTQSMSALLTSVSFGLQYKQATEAKGFELLVSFLKTLNKEGIRVAGTLVTEIEKLRVKTGPGGQRFTSDMHEFPVWENAVMVSMMHGSPLSQNAFIRAAVLCIAETDEPERQSVSALHHEIFSLKLKLNQDLKEALDEVVKLVRRYAVLLARFKNPSFAPVIEELELVKNFLAEMKRLYDSEKRQEDFKATISAISAGSIVTVSDLYHFVAEKKLAGFFFADVPSWHHTATKSPEKVEKLRVRQKGEQTARAKAKVLHLHQLTAPQTRRYSPTPRVSTSPRRFLQLL